MAKNKSGSKLWIAGTVLGAVAGAAYALWKTPMSGQELRSKLAPGPVNTGSTINESGNAVSNPGVQFLSKIEHTLAPIVGVELGRTANQVGSVVAAAAASVTEPIEAVKPQSAEDEAVEPTSTSSVTFGSDTIRAKRFAWGEPAPEPAPAVIEPEAAIEAVEAVEAVSTPSVPNTPAAATTGSYGSETIRARRFAWGDPAPDATGEVATETTAEVNDKVESVAKQAGEAAAEAVKSNLKSFPKLGGLEN